MRDDRNRLSVVADVLPSSWWRNAEVIVLACGHRHIRPKGYAPPKGEQFQCCFCEDASLKDPTL